MKDDAAGMLGSDESGNLYVSGYVNGVIDLGGGPRSTQTSLQAAFAASYSAEGAHLWSAVFGESGIAAGSQLIPAGGGTALLIGPFAGTADFGGGALTSVGALDCFLARLVPKL